MADATKIANKRKSHLGTILGILPDTLFTYTNIAYLCSLALTLFLSVALWRVSTLAQESKDLELERYKADAAVQVAKANAESEVARTEAAKALGVAAVATQRGAEAREAAAVADEKASRARIEAALADQRASEAGKTAAEAIEKAIAAAQSAGEANAGISRILTRRTLTPSQQQAIAVALRNHSGTIYEIGANTSGVDTVDLTKDIVQALTLAGWTLLDWNRAGPTYIDGRGHQIGSAVGSGIFVFYSPDSSSIYYPAARDLAQALTRAGLPTYTQVRPDGGARQDALIISVGTKMP